MRPRIRPWFCFALLAAICLLGPVAKGQGEGWIGGVLTCLFTIIAVALWDEQHDSEPSS